MFKRGLLYGPLMEEDAGTGGGGAGNPGAFDMNAFFTRLEQSIQTQLAPLKATVPPTPAAGGEGDKGNKGGNDSNSPRWKQLEADLASERTARQESEKKAEEKERHGLIRGFLSDFTFNNERAREDAFKAFSDEIKRGDNDGLIGPENESAKEYIVHQLEGDRAYWLKPKDVGGSGATNGGSRGGNQPVELNNIKPGMDANELLRVRAEIRRVALNALHGQ